MKEYLNYLKRNPKKLSFPLGASIFCVLCLILINNDKKEFIEGTTYGFYWFSQIFILLIIGASNYQPYKEWKDGKRN